MWVMWVEKSLFKKCAKQFPVLWLQLMLASTIGHFIVSSQRTPASTANHS